jgi:glycosyltransferase involved in cell wall biosynthesis
MHDVAGYYSRLAHGLKELGFGVTFYQFHEHKYNYEPNSSASDFPYYSQLQSYPWAKTEVKHVFSIKWWFHKQIYFRFFLWALKHHNVFIFAYGGSFFPKNLDIPILRLARKRVISFVAHGSEGRPAFMDGAHWGDVKHCDDPIQEIFRIAKRQSRQMRRVERWSSAIISTPLNSQFLRKSAINSYKLGKPSPIPDVHVKSKFPKVSNSIKIIHAPSHREAKGSDTIALIVNRVQKLYPELTYLEISGRPNKEVLQELVDADLVIDQLYSDTFLAGVGVEAAYLGVPSLVGSYAVDLLRKSNDPSKSPPLFLVHPDNIEKALLDILENRTTLKLIGNEARDFVAINFSPRSVAERFAHVIKGSIPFDWYFEPTEFSYVYGGGLKESDLKSIFCNGYLKYGDKFFCLRQRPDLLHEIHKLIEFERSNK